MYKLTTFLYCCHTRVLNYLEEYKSNVEIQNLHSTSLFLHQTVDFRLSLGGAVRETNFIKEILCYSLKRIKFKKTVCYS